MGVDGTVEVGICNAWFGNVDEVRQLGPAGADRLRVRCPLAAPDQATVLPFTLRAGSP
jgi:hypothetical protein